MTMFHEIIILFATGLAGSFGGWIFARRKKKAEAQAAEIGNLDLIAGMWQKTAQQFKQSYDELISQNNELLKQNAAIVTELNILRLENKQLHSDVAKLNKLVEDLKCENKALLKRINEIKKYQQDHSPKN